RENGRVNGFTEPEFTVICGNLADKVTGKFDVVAANIVADVVMMFSSQVGAFMKDDAVFITSGIIAPRADEVKAKLCENGFNIIETRRDGDWYCFVCNRRCGE
ncbi:MAG: 50S ribosomal protein L11 methyltransferase, partial [Clostridia bacterium]|nr:50S ribosomal protein L11 methyltransferase [Clostridia bacterium]